MLLTKYVLQHISLKYMHVRSGIWTHALIRGSECLHRFIGKNTLESDAFTARPSWHRKKCPLKWLPLKQEYANRSDKKIVFVLLNL